MRDIYFKYRKKIINKFPFLRYLKKYKIIIPKIKAIIIWRIIKPNKIKYMGKEFYTSIDEFSDPSRNLYAYGDHYETDERNLIVKYVDEGDSCIDIGANIGFYTWWFLKSSKLKGNVYSFECLNSVFNILKQNFEKNDNVKLFKGYVGINRDKNQDYLIPDNLIKEKISFIKIDIDGPDFFALKSCEKIIDSSSPKIIIELCENSFENWGIHYNEILNFLNKKKYSCFDVKNMQEEFNRTLKKNEIVNIFAIKE